MSKKSRLLSNYVMEKYTFEKPLIYSINTNKSQNKIWFENSLPTIEENQRETEVEDSIIAIGRTLSIQGSEEN